MDFEARIDAAFPPTDPPETPSLVVFDGLDQPAKEYAVRLFGGKTRKQVAALVGRGPSGVEGLWGIEDLEALEAAAIRYYLRPFLEFLLTNEGVGPTDFSFFLAYSLAEVLRRRGASVFTERQREVLLEIAHHFQTQLADAADDYSVTHCEHYSTIIQRLQVPQS